VTITSGIRSGLQSGMRSGLNPSSGGAAATVDATSGRYMPASSAEWTALLAGTGLSNPTSVYIPSGASGNLTDVIGGKTFVANGVPSYQQAVTGWSSVGVKPRLATTTDYFVATDVNPSTTSVAQLVYLSPNNDPASAHSLMLFGSATAMEARLTTGRLFQAVLGASIVSGVVAATLGSVVPGVLVFNRAASTFKLYTPVEIIVGVYASPSSATDHYVGAGYLGSDDTTILYIARWTSTGAELSDANARTLLTALGWSVAW
jgi:hypothetical protein